MPYIIVNPSTLELAVDKTDYYCELPEGAKDIEDTCLWFIKANPPRYCDLTIYDFDCFNLSDKEICDMVTDFREGVDTAVIIRKYIKPEQVSQVKRMEQGQVFNFLLFELPNYPQNGGYFSSNIAEFHQKLHCLHRIEAVPRSWRTQGGSIGDIPRPLALTRPMETLPSSEDVCPEENACPEKKVDCNEVVKPNVSPEKKVNRASPPPQIVKGNLVATVFRTYMAYQGHIIRSIWVPITCTTDMIADPLPFLLYYTGRIGQFKGDFYETGRKCLASLLAKIYRSNKRYPFFGDLTNSSVTSEEVEQVARYSIRSFDWYKALSTHFGNRYVAIFKRIITYIPERDVRLVQQTLRELARKKNNGNTLTQDQFGSELEIELNDVRPAVYKDPYVGMTTLQFLAWSYEYSNTKIALNQAYSDYLRWRDRYLATQRATAYLNHVKTVLEGGKDDVITLLHGLTVNNLRFLRYSKSSKFQEILDEVYRTGGYYDDSGTFVKLISDFPKGRAPRFRPLKPREPKTVTNSYNIGYLELLSKEENTKCGLCNRKWTSGHICGSDL